MSSFTTSSSSTTSSTTISSSGSTQGGIFNDGLTVQKKVVIKCDRCGKVIAEFYTDGAVIRSVTCKLCHNIDKLKE